MVGDHPVDLFRHCTVKAPQPRFHMCDGDMELCRCQCTGKRRVGIAKDYNPVWMLFQEHSLKCFEHAACLEGVRSRANSQVIVRRGKGKFIEELRRHAVIVVLPGVNNELLVVLPYRATYRRKRYELGARSHD